MTGGNKVIVCMHSSVELSSWEAKRNVVRAVFEPETSARKPDTLTTELRHLHRKVMSRKCQNVYYKEASYTVSLDSRRNRDWAHISKQFYLILRACKQRLRKVRPSSIATFAVSENSEAPKETQRSVRKKKRRNRRLTPLLLNLFTTTAHRSPSAGLPCWRL